MTTTAAATAQAQVDIRVEFVEYKPEAPGEPVVGIAFDRDLNWMQRPRAVHFIGLPEMVINFFRFVAEETRQIMAELGIRKLELDVFYDPRGELFPGRVSSGSNCGATFTPKKTLSGVTSTAPLSSRHCTISQ